MSLDIQAIEHLIAVVGAPTAVLIYHLYDYNRSMKSLIKNNTKALNRNSTVIEVAKRIKKN